MLRTTALAITVATIAFASGAVSFGHDAIGIPAEPDLVPEKEAMPVLTPDGRVLRCPQDDKPLMVTVEEAAHAPNLGESRLHADGRYEELAGSVPRCGPAGGGENGEPVWVPDRLAELEVAPRRFRR